MLSTWALIVCSLSPACLSDFSKPSRIGWFASCIAWTRCSYVSAWSASVMQPLSCRSAVFLSQYPPCCQDRLAILEKKRRDGLIALAQRMDWAVGYLDEVWWSRVAQPRMHAWSEVKQPLRLQERQVSKEDPDPKALCCYGMLDASSQEIRLRFVDG